MEVKNLKKPKNQRKLEKQENIEGQESIKNTYILLKYFHNSIKYLFKKHIKVTFCYLSING